MLSAKKIGSLIAMVVMLAALVMIGYFIQRTQFVTFIILSALCFGSYILLLTNSAFSLKQLLYFGLVCRAIFIFSIPVLSDDYFRFLWDGHLVNMGINPFLALPSSLMIDQAIRDNSTMQFLYNHMNSQYYFSVYPSIMQACFALSTWLFPASIKSPVIILHFIMTLAELGTCIYGIKILRLLRLSEKNILWYALNPLVIIELAGNLHFEAVMIFFCTASFFYLLEKKPVFAAMFISLAIATKLLPVICIPFFFKYLEKEHRLQFFFGTIIYTTILFIPFLNPVFFEHLLTSVALYFHSFEFNGSIYKVVRWIGYEVTGNNIIWVAGVVLPCIVLMSIFILYSRQVKNDETSLLKCLLFSFTIYLAMASIVHPWYVTMLVFLNIYLDYKFVYLWSATILLSYFTYSQIPYQESGWLSALEYLPVFGLMIYEFRNKRPFLKFRKHVEPHL
ncbi:MAG: glycosyltransferase 87 family protein [Ginsengibacter sp.]